MTILALEFSSAQRSVAVIKRSHFFEVIEVGSAANAPLTMIEEALRQATLEREQIDCIAVGLGPGSYTGIRATIALAQGWQLARHIRLLGISSAKCVAEQARADGLRGRVTVAIDAQREEFYLATYDLSENGIREIDPLQIVTRTEMDRRAAKEGVLIGPEVTQWFPYGRTVFPRAATIGKLALNRNDFISGEKLEPIYLRETKFVKAPPARIIS